MKKFLVSGVTSGMGKAFLTYAENQGAEIIPIVRPPHTHTYEKKYSHVISLDYAEPTQVIPAFSTLKESIDGFINFAAILPGQSIFETTVENLTKLFTINVITPMLICQAIRDKLKKNAVIILLGSISGHKGSYDDAYAATKGAI